MQRVVVRAEQIQGEILSLTAEQQHYLQRVLRLGTGDRFWVLNGTGDLWLATLSTQPAQATLTATTVAPPSDQALPHCHITLAAALPKQGFDEVVRQVTELGVDHIVPLISDRTLLRPSPNKLERWRRIAAEAAEQSERLTVPIISEPIAWLDWLSTESQDLRYFCVARQSAPSLLSASLSTQAAFIEVAIGPEGGWTEDECQRAIAQGYRPVTLGTNILRAVTAAVTALAILRAGSDFATMYPSVEMASCKPLKP